jgi:hypothetical protein
MTLPTSCVIAPISCLSKLRRGSLTSVLYSPLLRLRWCLCCVKVVLYLVMLLSKSEVLERILHWRLGWQSVLQWGFGWFIKVERSFLSLLKLLRRGLWGFLSCLKMFTSFVKNIGNQIVNKADQHFEAFI